MRTWTVAFCLMLMVQFGPHAARADDDQQEETAPILTDAEVRVVVTNAGTEVGPKASVQFYKGGTHTVTGMLGNVSAGWAESGQTIKLPTGQYDIRVTFEDGNARKTVWLDRQDLSGTISRTVELALPMTDLRVAVTNGGIDVGRNASIHVYPAGTHAGNGVRTTASVGLGDPGQSIRLAAGTYDVRISFADSGAEKTIWLDSLPLAGLVEKTVEIGLPMADVRYVITNGGIDVGHKGDVHIFKAGSHATVATSNPPNIGWTTSGQAMRLPAGTYDVRITFEDGDVRKVIWYDNLPFAGTVERSVEVGLTLAQARIVVTNGGVPVRDNAQIAYFQQNRRDGSGTHLTNGGETVRLPPGVYDVRIRFADGSATKDIWLNALPIAGAVEKTVDVGLNVAEVCYTITNDGAETGMRGEARFYVHGRRDGPPIETARSGIAVRLPEGAYDVHVVFVDGETKRDLWLDNQVLANSVQRTIEVGVPIAVVHVMVTLNGADTGARGEAHFYRHGQRSGGSVGWVRSGGTLRVPEGAYDVRVTFADGETRKNIWLDNQSFIGPIERAFEIGGAPNLVR